MLASSQSTLICPLTQQPFKDPRFLLEDGFSYEKSAIETWLRDKPNESPMIGNIPSATLLPNLALRRDFVCPITKEPFKEPYFCVEDNQTYEKEAIIKWYETRVKQNADVENYAYVVIRSPINGLQLDSLTLYPNKALFPNGELPSLQEPLKFDVSSFISPTAAPAKTICVFDDEIRELICQYTKNHDEGLRDKIDARRTLLGLQVKHAFWGGLDLTHLDLSNLTLKGLPQKGSLFKDTNFSGSTLIDCSLSRCRFVNCNLQKAVLINCDFQGEEVSFFNSDMKDAVIEPKSAYIEKGATWQPIRQPNEFRAELKSRGALNTDTITFK